MFLVSSCSCLCPIHWSHVLSREWRYSWSSADRQCSNYIWVINMFIAYLGATYMWGLTVITLPVFDILSVVVTRSEIAAGFSIVLYPPVHVVAAKWRILNFWLKKADLIYSQNHTWMKFQWIFMEFTSEITKGNFSNYPWPCLFLHEVNHTMYEYSNR